MSTIRTKHRRLAALRRLPTALTLCGAFALSGCSESEVPNFLSSGGNGYIYASADFTRLSRHYIEGEAKVTQYSDWLDSETEEIRWVSHWGADKPWCSMIGPSQAVNWSAQGLEKPAPRLRCINMQGQALPSVNLPHAFLRADIDPTGKSVVLYSSENTRSGENLIFVGQGNRPDPLFNSKLAAVVDLGQSAVKTLSIEGFGAAVQSVQFPEVDGDAATFEVDGKARRPAVFLANGEIVMVDLNDPQLSQLAVTSRAAGLHEEAMPLMRLIPARPGLDSPLLLLAADHRSDIEQLRLRARADRPEALDADYSILTTQFPARDMKVFEIEGRPWLLSATRLGLSMIDLQSSEETLITEFGGIGKLGSFQTQDGRTMAWAAPKQGRAISVIEPAKALTSLGRKPTKINLGHAFTRLIELADRRIAAVGSTSITVAELESGKQSPLGGLENAAQVFYPGNSYLYLIMPDFTPGMNRSILARVNLSTMIPETHPIEYSMAGSAPLEFFNNQQDLGIRLHHYDDGQVGIASLGVNAAQLSELKGSWLEGK